MKNVNKVFTGKWMSADSVGSVIRDFRIEDGMTALEFRNAILSEFDGSESGSYVRSLTAPFVDFQTKHGVVIPDVSSARAIAVEAYKTVFGNDIDTTEESHVGRMIEQSALNLVSALGFVAANVMQTDINTANGRYLDAIGALFWCARKQGAKTELSVTINGSGEVERKVIKAGTVSFTDRSGVRFDLVEDLVLNEDNEFSATGGFVCSKEGQIEPNGTVDDFSFKGLDDDLVVKGYQLIQYGYDIEDDESYRNRIKLCRPSGTGFIGSVQSAILSLDGVYNCLVQENTSSEETPVTDAIRMPGHSIFVCVDYDGAETTKDAIGKAIYENKSCGCGYAQPNDEGETAFDNGMQTVKVRDRYSAHEYDVYFWKTRPQGFDVQVRIDKNDYSGDSLEDEVKSAIDQWSRGKVANVNRPVIGHKVSAFEIGAAISDVIPDIRIVSVGVKTAGIPGVEYAESVDIAQNCIGTVSDVKVVVTEED